MCRVTLAGLLAFAAGGCSCGKNGGLDHMSHSAAEEALRPAEGIPGGGYPLVSGHSAIRNPNGEGSSAGNSRGRSQLRRIACLQGMFGLGTDGADAYDWARQYLDATSEMRRATTSHCPNKVSSPSDSVAFGTDTNSLVKSPRPTMGPEMKPDVRTSPGGADLVDQNLFRSADYFWRMWQRIEAQKVNVP
jgi:hypothetical protein